MPRKATLLKSLSRGRIRASFNKYNLFNLYKKGRIDFKSKTLYQQKWSAKQETRAYHGEHITESRWQMFFNPKLKSVAQLDASLRTSTSSKNQIEPTPFLMQTYAVLEKRLDFAIFRAMFASSVRQARQFILHGNVRVNGIKIKHPGFTLKPGDTFSVHSSKVLQAMGAKKPSFEEALRVDKKQIVLWNKYVKEAKENPRSVWEAKIKKYQGLDESNSKKMKYLEFLEMYNKNLEIEQRIELQNSTPEKLLTKILEIQAKEGDKMLSAKSFEKIVDKDPLLVQEVYKCYQEFLNSDKLDHATLKNRSLKELQQLSSQLVSQPKEFKENLSDKAKKSIRQGITDLSTIAKKYQTSISQFYRTNKAANNEATGIPFHANWTNRLISHLPLNVSEIREKGEKESRKIINLPWQRNYFFGRQDPTKPYFTPWKPRPFLAPFSILPHHLEVSFKTCHAVYLRDPVARPGHSEVISLFDLPVHERAYMYYVRNGK
ncbi:mitochondrial 37S ribosomal protein uS4m NDAI_0F02990 [Naumovozyma dairenensis CBS 421]|uniref:Small ribosomal subunit protein uS4m n=1 Tax=Naumovozyma dairenensis (strain ATCC 10597 / BCRC 20456 / CBS 421 / NBRC 0211 / NRRL Y-12639) TaxID=1071378 RepID=G0WCV6_NAUDC|nr:hypothetical protein NDAI_0F02990 [Naumovozyma dairenensis CBS 421]CCD25617.1 hypothetical protein NDAI_0F02990 [Naumovozyma dairenensis CBS 421]